MSEVPASQRLAAKIASEVFGGSRRVNAFYDDSGEDAIDILTCEGSPNPGLSTYSTLGLHLVPNLMDGHDIRIEMMGVAGTGALRFPNVLASAAAFVKNDGWLCAPGVVFPHLVSEYELSTILKHILWVPPFNWEALSSVALGSNITAHWLVAMPISDAERAFLIEHGFDELEARFAAADVAYYDLGRPSIL